MKLKVVYSILFIFFLNVLWAQKKSSKQFNAEGENAIYTKEWSIGIRIHSNGYSGFFEQVWIKNIKKRKLLQVNAFIYADFREKKIGTLFNRDGFPNAYKYYYGKINNFYTISALYGNRSVIANKSETSGVKLSISYLGGFTLGFLKPYYLRFARIEANRLETFDEAYSEENHDQFLNSNPFSSRVYGAGSFWKGFDEIEFYPGLQAKVSLNFDFARKNSLITSLDIGLQMDLYYKKINTYLTNKNKPYIFNVYLAFQMGKRN